MNVEYINPFVEASAGVIKTLTGYELVIGKVFLKESPFVTEEVAVIVGITGKIRGQVIFSIKRSVACDIVSKMMFGAPVTELDEMSKSALSELGNMIMGNTATIFSQKGLEIDITPPTILVGNDMQFSANKVTIICIPFILENETAIELHVSFAES